MIGSLNQLMDYVETHLSDDLDIADLASSIGTTDLWLPIERG